MRLNIRVHRKWIGCAALALALVALATAWAGHTAARAASPAEPWTAEQVVQPADLAKELAASRSPSSPEAAKPNVVYVGFRPLYNGGHIPGASFHGDAGKPKGLADLKAFASYLPHDTNLVIYCGCCPLEKCPNIRAAFTALNGMGFTHLRVLMLPTDFNTDWIGKGYPVEKATLQ
jgi:thiosulfate/3-mercaptopyruvate sulfurtransferase